MSFDWGGFGAGLLQGVERGLIIGDKLNEAVRKGRFKNSVDKANKDQETATAELNDERNRRAAAVADLEASKPGESLKETPEMAIPNMRFGESQAGGLQVPKQQTAIPVSSFSSFSEREMPQQAVRGAISPALADPQGAMSDDEYRRRSMAISRDKQRSYLDAQLAYYDNDPDKYMEIQKKRFQMDVNDDIKGRIERAMSGDGQAIGEMVNTLQKAGVFPQGEVKRNGDQVALVDPKSGKTIWQGAITPGLIQQNAALYAMAENALANDEFDKVYQIGKDRRAEGREDQKLALEGRKVAVSEGDLDNKRYATDVNAAYLKAKALGTGGGDGTAAMSQLPQGTHIALDPNDPDGQRQLIINTKTHEPMGEWRNRRPYPLTPMTDVEKANGERLQAEGWIPTIKYDSTGLVKFAMRDPETGDYVFADAPDHVIHEPQPTAIDWPTRGGAGRGNLAGAQTQGGGSGGAVPQGTAGQGSGSNRVEIPVETTDEPKKAAKVPKKAAETPKADAPKQAITQGTKKETSKKAIEVDAVSRAQPRRYANDVMPSARAKNKGWGDYLKALQDDARYDTSGYTDKQLAQVNADRARRGLDPLKAMNEKPKTEGILARAVRQSRERNAAWDARTKAEQEAKKNPPAPKPSKAFEFPLGKEKAINEAGRLGKVMQNAASAKAKPVSNSKGDKGLDLDSMVVREGRTKSQQEQSEFSVLERVTQRLYPKMEKAKVNIQALTPEKLKKSFSSFGGKGEKTSDYFWRLLCKNLKDYDKDAASTKERIDNVMRRAAMKPGIHKRAEELRKNG